MIEWTMICAISKGYLYCSHELILWNHSSGRPPDFFWPIKTHPYIYWANGRAARAAQSAPRFFTVFFLAGSACLICLPFFRWLREAETFLSLQLFSCVRWHVCHFIQWMYVCCHIVGTDHSTQTNRASQVKKDRSTPQTNQWNAKPERSTYTKHRHRKPCAIQTTPLSFTPKVWGNYCLIVPSVVGWPVLCIQPVSYTHLTLPTKRIV